MKVIVYGYDAEKMHKACSEDVIYQNPSFFDKAKKASKVIMLGEYSNVRSAYESEGVEVVLLEDDKPEKEKVVKPTDPAKASKKASKKVSKKAK